MDLNSYRFTLVGKRFYTGAMSLCTEIAVIHAASGRPESNGGLPLTKARKES